MSTKAEREEEARSLDLQGVKQMIKDGMNNSQMRVIIKGNGVQFMTPHGNVVIPDDSIKYYYTIFNETIQKIRKYEDYISRIDNILANDDPTYLCQQLKDIINWFGFSELYREKYSVITQWLGNDSITKDDLKKLYYAYSGNTIANLPQQLVDVYKKSLKKTLEYYNVLLKMFDLFDRAMFRGEEIGEEENNPQ